MTEDERKEVTPDIEDERKEVTPNIEDVLADFGVKLLSGLMRDRGSISGVSDDEDAVELMKFASIFENGLYIGDVAFGICIFDALWIELVKDFVSDVRIPESFGKERYEELTKNLKCMSYNDLALMECDVRDSVVDALEDLACHLADGSGDVEKDDD